MSSFPAPASPSTVRVVVVGLGGIGSALLPMLASMQLGGITIIDGDVVEERNLPRQLLYGKSDVGRLKAQAAMERCDVSGPGRISAECRFLDIGNAADLFQGASIIADCTDDLPARALIERTSSELGLPLVSGAVHGSQIQVLTRHPQHGSSDQGSRSFFSGRPSEEQEGCDMRDVPVAVTSIAACLMTMRIEDLLRGGDGLSGMLDLLDVANGRWMRFRGPGPLEPVDTPIKPMRHA
ncbi:MAG: ThiF family adenylyltransferase [Flavobacteriales bacterium]